MSDSRYPDEPNMEIASGWWRELPDKFTTVGWKDHLFRFAVLHNGTILAEPGIVYPGADWCTNKRSVAWRGQGMQLAFFWTLHDNEEVLQGWNECASPVLWSEWCTQGLVLRQEVFAHVPDGVAVSTGTEPLFAWVRLSVHDIYEGLPLDDKHVFQIKINAPHLHWNMHYRHNLEHRVEESGYPRPLVADGEDYQASRGFRLVEDGGRVRLGIPQAQQCRAAFSKGARTDALLEHEQNAAVDLDRLDRFNRKFLTERDHLLNIEIDATKGSFVDVLVPMVPTDRDVFDAELALGYDGALAEANRYWSVEPETAAVFDVPEEIINCNIRRSLQSAEVIAEKHPEDGSYCILTGGWTYPNLWATPTSMAMAGLLDIMGYHCVLEKYLDVIKRDQGTVPPPGNALRGHPGYLGVPRDCKSIDWLCDHGALLWVISEHVMLSGDPETADKWLPVIEKACDFIQYARRVEGHGGVPGVMPAAVSTDCETTTQSTWADGWIHKGLTTAIKALRRWKSSPRRRGTTGTPLYGRFARRARTARSGPTRTASSTSSFRRLSMAPRSGRAGTRSTLTAAPRFWYLPGL
jgi:hypothetical protein